MHRSFIVAALAAAASTVHAHATFQYLWINGVDEGTKCVRTPANNSPITDLTSKTVACNNNGEVAAAAICPVAAGSKAAVEMQQHDKRDCAEEAIGGNHDGPVIVYMAKVDNAATAVGSESNWFKVAETGLVSKDYWGTDVMNAKCGKVEFTIPSDLSAGNYLIRAEAIALHSAGQAGGAQLYMSCYQVNVTGGGAASPPTVKFPGAYSATDPGILYNINASNTTYIVPGPPVYSSGGSSPSAPAANVTGTNPPAPAANSTTPGTEVSLPPKNNTADDSDSTDDSNSTDDSESTDDSNSTDVSSTQKNTTDTTPYSSAGAASNTTTGPTNATLPALNTSAPNSTLHSPTDTSSATTGTNRTCGTYPGSRRLSKFKYRRQILQRSRANAPDGLRSGI